MNNKKIPNIYINYSTKIKIVKFCIIIFATILNKYTFSQDSLKNLPQNINQQIMIDIDTAMKMSLQHSESLKAASANLNSSEFDEKTTTRSFLPNFSATSNITWNQGNTDGSDFSFPQNAPSSSSNASLTLAQPKVIPFGGQCAMNLGVHKEGLSNGKEEIS